MGREVMESPRGTGQDGHGEGRNWTERDGTACRGMGQEGDRRDGMERDGTG